MKRKKPKFNTLKCIKCIYHGVGCNGYAKRVCDKQKSIYCNYFSRTGKTCLRKQDGQVVDIRGEDYNGCLLYEEGNNKHKVRLKL